MLSATIDSDSKTRRGWIVCSTQYWVCKSKFLSGWRSDLQCRESLNWELHATINKSCTQTQKLCDRCLFSVDEQAFKVQEFGIWWWTQYIVTWHFRQRTQNTSNVNGFNVFEVRWKLCFSQSAEFIFIGMQKDEARVNFQFRGEEIPRRRN